MSNNSLNRKIFIDDLENNLDSLLNSIEAINYKVGKRLYNTRFNKNN
ncbi:MAG TPA: hypothetical protein ACYCDB_01395 [Candidatus Azoamicus sp.]